MAYNKTIICLANSRKTSGRCVAGIELTASGAGGWIRPVSSRPAGELSDHDRRYRDGVEARVLDRISIRFLQPQQHAFQPENHLIDDGYYWDRIGTATANEVAKSVERPSTRLWIDGHSTYHGFNDKIPLALCTALGSSLRLIRPAQTTIWVGTESGYQGAQGKRRVRALFDWGGGSYKLQVTDPLVEASYLAGADGCHVLTDAILCLSLSEPYEGHTFKLVAAII